MRVLVLGGGVFVGRHLVETAAARGWDVTVLTRGRRALPRFTKKVNHVVGDRRRDTECLSGTWDAVVDTCGYRAEDVAFSAKVLRSRVGTYVFVSSASVYPRECETGHEDSPLAVPARADLLNPRSARDYGPLKVACEQEVATQFGDRAVVTRPGLVVGPHDPSDRFGYWPQRLALGGDVLAPGRPTDLAQLIDARDHAAFVLNCLAAGVTGTFNVVSQPMPMSEVLTACTPAETDVSLHWIASELLRLNRIEPWTELPLWSGLKAVPRIDTRLAELAGLVARPLASTASDTLEWERQRPDPFPRLKQLARDRERELLRLYK